MKQKELRQLRYCVEVMNEYQAVFEDRAEIYADVAGQVSSMKAEFSRLLEEAEEDKKKE